LAVVDQPIIEFEKQAFLLAGLGSDYDPVVTSVTTRVEPLFIEEFYKHLLTHESRLEHNQPIIDLPTADVHLVSRQSCHRGGRGVRGSFPNNFPGHTYFYDDSSRFTKGRGHGSSSANSGSSGRGPSQRPMCQIRNRMDGPSCF
jgi:hypothetical protein